MKRGHLADRFEGVGVKRLSAVDADPGRSNQHEIGTTLKMRQDFLGEVRRERAPTMYVWLGEDREGITVESWSHHYDSRLDARGRSPEWRLYYPSNPVTEAMRPGDTLFLAKDRNGGRWFIVAPKGSTGESQLLWLFGLRPEGQKFVSREFTGAEPELDFAARYILDGLGVEYGEPEADRLDAMVERYGATFPKTAEFSRNARDTLPEASALDDPDAALLAWLDREEALFRRLERRIVTERLELGFMTPDGAEVEEFIGFSLGVHNRRKSRMGYSLEHQVAAVLDAHNVAYARDAIIDDSNKPDFLFPSLEAYKAADAGDPALTMLGAKSSCKERWRQVLREADKIPRKHLLTLEPGITEAQTEKMEASKLQLIVPKAIQVSYTATQREWLWSVADFIAMRRAGQSGPA